MIQNKSMKIVIDIVMSVALIFLMAYQVVGDKYHEWIGVGMLLLFLAHNGLNLSWYRNIFKGKYSAQRVARTVVNFLVLVAIILTGYSGIVLSKHVFAFLPINSGMALARKLHLAGSYWSFVLMSFHIGMHWSMMTRKIKILSKGDGSSSYIIWIFRIMSGILAIYGAILFGRADIYANMFLENQFAILDYETAGVFIILQNFAMLSAWVFVGHNLTKALVLFSIKGQEESSNNEIRRISRSRKLQGLIYAGVSFVVIICSILSIPKSQNNNSWGSPINRDPNNSGNVAQAVLKASDEFIFLKGGTYKMGSPNTESWRSEDENQHTVTVSDFYMSAYELTQAEYKSVMGNNPSTFKGDKFPVENISWLDAVAYCNERSEKDGLTPVYLVEGDKVSWNRGADGYRLPTEAEWEYACRAGTYTPFNTKTSISAEEANYFGHYPYDIEENYFEQQNLKTKPGVYRESTVAVDSFSPNAWGLYNMHGNVSEWVWDYYGSYGTESMTNPTGPATGNLRVYRGGGWNDFAKNLRSAYRATLEENKGSYNIGIRLVRNAVRSNDDIIGIKEKEGKNNIEKTKNGRMLIVFYSWGGNTKGVANEIRAQTGADLFEITLDKPYSSDYNTVLNQSQHDQNIQARPKIAGHINNMDEYETILLGYPNWWASIPMPIATFLEEYNFSGKTIIPFCSHGGGRFGQSLTAIAKLAPDSNMGEGLAINYSGGSSLQNDVKEWLKVNGINK